MVLLSGLESNGCTKKCFTNTQFHQQVLQLVRKLRMKLVIWSNAFLLIGKTKKLTWSLSLVELVTLKVRLDMRSEEHTSELQSRPHLVCRLLLEKKNNITHVYNKTYY